MDRRQAEESLEAGVDVLVAMGGEGGGNGGSIATMVLVPEVVDVAGDVPVLAAGGIANGRGLAAALALGAQGAQLGTRFLASAESAIARECKERIVAAEAADAVKVPNSERVMPPFNVPGWPAVPRALRSPLIERLGTEPDSVDAAATGREFVAALHAGRGDEQLPFTGQSAGLIREILPAAEIVRRLVSEAEAALLAASVPSA